MNLKKRNHGNDLNMNNSNSQGSDAVVLITAGYDHQIKFWQADNGLCKKTIQHPDSQVNDMDISPDKKLVLVAGYQHIRLFDVTTSNVNPIINFDGMQRNVTCVGYHKDAKWMFSGGEDATVKIWDIRSRNLHCQKMYQANAPINTACLHPNQSEIFIGDQNGIIHIWDLRMDTNVQITHDPGTAIQSISVNAEATSLAAVNSKGNCIVYRITNIADTMGSQLTLQSSFQAHQKYALKCQYSPDSTLLATTSADGTAVIWRTSGNTKLHTLIDKSQRWVWDCAFSDDSQYILTASSDNIARLWNTGTGEKIRDFIGHSKAITCLAFKDAAAD